METENKAALPEGRRNVIVQYFTRMPVVFPLVGLFLLVLAGAEAWNYYGDGEVSFLYRLRPAVLLLYFLFWAGVCFERKKAGLAFLCLTILNVAFYLFGPESVMKHALGDLLFIPLPVNILFSFLLLFYFRKLK